MSQSKQPIEIVLDLETLSTAPDAVISQIAMIAFDGITGEQLGTLNCFPQLEEQIQAGRSISEDTLLFWFSQDKSVIDSVYGEAVVYRSTLAEVSKMIQDFFAFFKDPRAIWQHSTFDIPILGSYIQSNSTQMPWHYHVPKDIQTLEYLYEMQKGKRAPKPINEQAHNAMADCRAELEFIQTLKEGVKCLT